MTNIGKYAFAGCVSLTNINIPNSVSKIGKGAFCGCRSLTSITIPNGLSRIENDTFSYCINLTSVTIPESVEYIAGIYDAFEGCEKLVYIYGKRGSFAETWARESKYYIFIAQ